jgi:hypothetical protein
MSWRRAAPAASASRPWATTSRWGLGLGVWEPVGWPGSRNPCLLACAPAALRAPGREGGWALLSRSVAAPSPPHPAGRRAQLPGRRVCADAGRDVRRGGAGESARACTTMTPCARAAGPGAAQLACSALAARPAAPSQRQPPAPRCARLAARPLHRRGRRSEVPEDRAVWADLHAARLPAAGGVRAAGPRRGGCEGGGGRVLLGVWMWWCGRGRALARWVAGGAGGAGGVRAGGALGAAGGWARAGWSCRGGWHSPLLPRLQPWRVGTVPTPTTRRPARRWLGSTWLWRWPWRFQWPSSSPGQTCSSSPSSRPNSRRSSRHSSRRSSRRSSRHSRRHSSRHSSRRRKSRQHRRRARRQRRSSSSSSSSSRRCSGCWRRCARLWAPPSGGCTRARQQQRATLTRRRRPRWCALRRRRGSTPRRCRSCTPPGRHSATSSCRWAGGRALHGATAAGLGHGGWSSLQAGQQLPLPALPSSCAGTTTTPTTPACNTPAHPQVPVLAVSSVTGQGLQQLHVLLAALRPACAMKRHSEAAAAGGADGTGADVGAGGSGELQAAAGGSPPSQAYCPLAPVHFQVGGAPCAALHAARRCSRLPAALSPALLPSRARAAPRACPAAPSRPPSPAPCPLLLPLAPPRWTTCTRWRAWALWWLARLCRVP